MVAYWVIFADAKRHDEDIDRCDNRDRCHRDLTDDGRSHKDGDAGEHADRGKSKTAMPAERLADVAAQEWSHGGAQVDTHVENGEAAVALHAAGTIQRADHRRNIGFEEAVASDQ